MNTIRVNDLIETLKYLPEPERWNQIMKVPLKTQIKPDVDEPQHRITLIAERYAYNHHKWLEWHIIGEMI